MKLSLLLVVLIITSCNSKKNSEERDPNAYYATIEKSGNQDVVVCDVSKINRKVKLPLSKLVKNCEIIHLETTETSLLPEIRRHAVSENYVCVAGFEGPVKLFKHDGSFICDIGKLGRGQENMVLLPIKYY